MSELNKMETPTILSSKTKSVPSIFLLKNKTINNEISKEINSNTNNPYERLKLIDEIISTKNSELIKIKSKLTAIEKKEKLIEKEKYEINEESLPYAKKQELLEINKIKGKLNLQNISLNNKLKQINDKADRIEAELLYENRPGLNEYIKEKLKEVLNQKDLLMLKINENNNEIQKINEKDIKNKYKYNKKIFLQNLDNNNYKINQTNKTSNLNKKYLSENNINNNTNKNYQKCLYEEETNKKINEQKLKEKKYKEMREQEIKTVQNRKNMHYNLEKEMKSRNWINNFANNKNFLSWDSKEKQRIKDEENLIMLSNNERNLKYKPITSEELKNFSNKVKKEEIKIKNNLKIKKKFLEELWKERKDKLPKHKSKFLMINIQNDNKAKNDLLLKKETIKSNMFERINFSDEVYKKFKPKLIDEKIKKERINRIIELNGINKKREIKEMDDRLKTKLIKIINSQPKNFRKKNVFKTSKSVAEQQIIKLQNYKNLNLELSEIIKKEKDENKNAKITNSENTENNNIKNEDKKIIFKQKNYKDKLINKATGDSHINFNSEGNINSNNNNNIKQLKSENSYKQFIKEIQTKLKILNKLIE